MKIELQLLGRPAITIDGRAVELARAKGLALLVYLAVTRAPQPREAVVALLWPDSLAVAGRKNLRNTLWAVHAALGEGVVLAGERLSLAPAVVVDLHRLEDAVTVLESYGGPALALAVEQYRGPLADGLLVRDAPDFELWLSAEQARTLHLFLRLVERLIALEQARGDWAAVVRYARQGIGADPLHEPLYQHCIAAYGQLGQRAQALQCYDELALTLRRELDVAPLPATEALVAAARSGTLAAAPAVPRRAAAESVPAPFVGRAAELAALDLALRDAHAGPQVVVLAGELGIGKSRLWQQWSTSLALSVPLLVTHALETAQPVPLGPLVTLLRQSPPAVALVTPPSSLAPIWLAELQRLLPELPGRWPALPAPLALPPLEERARLFEALTAVVRALAAPVAVLVIDDLHWADTTTLDWLVYALDAVPPLPLLVVATYRPSAAPPQLLRMLAAWQRQGQRRPLDLAPLAAAEMTALLAAVAPAASAAAAAHWQAQSGGNPYFLLELQRAPTDAPPPDVASLIRRRLQATLAPGALQVLQAAALLGDHSDPATLCATSGRSEEETLDALDALLAAGLLSEVGAGYRFMQPLVASVVRADLSAARRAALHRRAAHALASAADDALAGAIMAHYAAAGELGPAALYATRAGAYALRLPAFAEAATFYRAALGWQPSPALHLALAQALVPQGAVDEAQAHLDAAAQGFAAAADLTGQAQALLELAKLAIMGGRPQTVAAHIARLQALPLDTLGSAVAIESHLLLAAVARYERRFAAAAAQVRLAQERGAAAGRPEVVAQGHFERGNLLANQGDLVAAVAAFGAAQALAAQVGSPVQQAMAANNLAYHTLLLGDLAAATAHLAVAWQVVEQYALGALWQYLYSTAGELALAQGDLDAAVEHFNAAETAAQRWHNEAHIANVQINQAAVALARGAPADAQRWLTQAQLHLSGQAEPFVAAKLAALQRTVDTAGAAGYNPAA